MSAINSVVAAVLLAISLVAWPSGALLQAQEQEPVKPPQEKEIYPDVRERSVAEAEVRDITIQSAVVKAFIEDDAIRANRVDVKVTEGVVHLSGQVPDEDARERAERIASGVANVEKVVNDLKVADGS